MMSYVKFVFILLLCLLPNQLKGENICQPEAPCKEIDNCPSFESIVADLGSRTNLKILKQAQCGYSNDSPKVCCSTNSNNNARPKSNIPKIEGRFGDADSSSECGIQNSDNRIIDGTVTSIDEFPWMAVLKYRTPHGLAIACGGALLNNRYVLTAAHCVTGSKAEKLGILEYVTLGEYDITTKRDCDLEWGPNECVEQAADYRVEKVIPHPEYRPDTPNRYNDIAMLRLMTYVTYTDFIKPICLSSPELESELNSEKKKFLFVAGWGNINATTSSTIKLKAKVPFVNFQNCSQWYRTKGVNLSQSQICAGGERKDSCRGDSGGPLMYLKIINADLVWHVVGVTSFGYKNCGTVGIPSIYTKITPYLKWINTMINSK